MKITPLPLRISALFLCIATALLALPSATQAQGIQGMPDESPFVELVSTDGVKIDAEILRVDNNGVRIRRMDRQEFTFPLSMLNERSRQIVQAWAVDQALANSLEIRVRERSNRTRNSDNVTTGFITTTQLQFTVINKSDIAVDGLRIEYRIFVNREQLNVPNNRFSTEEVIPGRLTINQLAGGKEVVLDANPVIKLIERRYNSNIVPSHGSNRSSQDKVEGYWYRVYRGRNLITESSTPRRLMQVKTWTAAKD